MYIFTPSQDVDCIRRAILSPNNIQYNFDDTYKGNPNLFQPPLTKDITYIKVSEIVDNKEIVYGFFFLIRKAVNVAEAHMAFLPNAYGKVAAIGIECLQWVWNNIDFEHLVAPCLESNRLATNIIKTIGFTLFDRVENAWLKNGKYETYCYYHVAKEKSNNHNISEV